MPLIIEIDEEANVLTCIYGTHGVHDDGRGQSRSHLTMSKGDMMRISKKI